MNDSIMSVIIILLVVAGWGAIILRDFDIAKGKMKGNWVHLVAAIAFAFLLIWVATIF
ncbi:hypothetical protein [Halobacillus aidingensis]|uniref:Uncharacterized protein n=1 Tax=Halobacillus aidingensis TaxID=240303 RepID=A0A1H0QQ46_HALAD|nr:hypothetical protein [Halobacillus aidingensis]SDP19392.1 hypothetical protein SAMN05421677_11386 [Halobacillus aidingensis]